MENSKGSSNIRSFMYSGKHALLPPKIPFPSVTPSYVDFVPNSVTGSKTIQKTREGNTLHQRTSSETFLMEEQPSWLDDLLNEPETPVRKGGHRRSSSDSFAYIDVANGSGLDYATQEEYKNKNLMFSGLDYATQEEYKNKNLMSVPSWAAHDLDQYKDGRKSSPFAETNKNTQKNRAWDMPLNATARSSGVTPAREATAVSQSPGTLPASHEADKASSISIEKLDLVESSPTESKNLSEKKDGSHAKFPASEADTKRAKQQFAQRSRVRKLQYIAELERNVQALQVEGSDVSAELEFLNQQNLILSMENKALKHRLESLAQEQLIKYMEHEVLEREIGRLRALYRQQQQQQQPSSNHRRTNSKDLDSKFANLSLKNKDANSSHDSVTGPLRI